MKILDRRATCDPLKCFTAETRWFSGSADIPLYTISEMLGTKLRALYQRRKGRDLFDLWHSHTCGVLEPELVVDTFLRYMNEDGEAPRRKVFLENLREKMHSPAFLSDATPLLRPGLRYDPKEAGLLVERLLLSRLSK